MHTNNSTCISNAVLNKIWFLFWVSQKRKMKNIITEDINDTVIYNMNPTYLKKIFYINRV